MNIFDDEGATKHLLVKYVHYHEYLEKLGSFPLNANIVIENLNPSRGLLQSCYKEIKEFKKKGYFDGNLIEYLCWISALNLKILARGEDLAEFIKKFYKYKEEDSRNTLRLAARKPELFDGSKELILLWLEYYMNDVKSIG